MKELVTKAGGRRYVNEDFINLQNYAATIESFFKGIGKAFVLSGLEGMDTRRPSEEYCKTLKQEYAHTQTTYSFKKGVVFLDGVIREVPEQTITIAWEDACIIPVDKNGPEITYKDGTTAPQYVEKTAIIVPKSEVGSLPYIGMKKIRQYYVSNEYIYDIGFPTFDYYLSRIFVDKDNGFKQNINGDLRALSLTTRGLIGIGSVDESDDPVYNASLGYGNGVLIDCGGKTEKAFFGVTTDSDQDRRNMAFIDSKIALLSRHNGLYLFKMDGSTISQMLGHLSQDQHTADKKITPHVGVDESLLYQLNIKKGLFILDESPIDASNSPLKVKSAEINDEVILKSFDASRCISYYLSQIIDTELFGRWAPMESAITGEPLPELKCMFDGVNLFIVGTTDLKHAFIEKAISRSFGNPEAQSEWGRAMFKLPKVICNAIIHTRGIKTSLAPVKMDQNILHGNRSDSDIINKQVEPYKNYRNGLSLSENCSTIFQLPQVIALGRLMETGISGPNNYAFGVITPSFSLIPIELSGTGTDGADPRISHYCANYAIGPDGTVYITSLYYIPNYEDSTVNIGNCVPISPNSKSEKVKLSDNVTIDSIFPADALTHGKNPCKYEVVLRTGDFVI